MIEYHVLLLALLVGSQALFSTLAALNVRHGARESRANAEWLDERIGVESVDELIDYNRATAGLGQLQSWTLLALLLVALYAGAFGDAVAALRDTGAGPIAQGLVFFLALLVLQRVAQTPFDLYETFVIDEQFGFNEQTPRLWLHDAVVDVFDRAGFETSDIYTMDASRRSSRLNAYFTGFGSTKRVVLFDTLVQKLSVPEIQSVLAHELAHWKKAHIWKGLGASAVRTGVAFAALGYLVDAG